VVDAAIGVEASAADLEYAKRYCRGLQDVACFAPPAAAETEAAAHDQARVAVHRELRHHGRLQGTGIIVSEP